MTAVTSVLFKMRDQAPGCGTDGVPEPNKKPAPLRLLAVALGLLLLSGCAGGRSTYSGASAEASRYSHRMHNRFFEAWTPRLSASPRGKLSVPVDVQIDRGGQILSFKIVRPSGNRDFDSSIAAVARKVTRVTPPPLGRSQHQFNLRIYFDLDVNYSKRARP